MDNSRNVTFGLHVATSSSRSPSAAVAAAIKKLCGTKAEVPFGPMKNLNIEYFHFCSDCLITYSVEDGRVDATVIISQQHKTGQMADNPPLLASVVFDLQKHNVPQIKYQTTRHTLMNPVNTTLF